MATHSKNTFETMTDTEIYKLEAAMKDPEFRRLLCEHAQEVRDGRPLYESEMAKAELERGFLATFLHPEPGYVLKTANLRTDEKVFVNVCSDPSVGAPVSAREPGTSAVKWSIPYMQSPQSRRDLDRGGRPCAVYDVIFHPEAVAFTTPRLKGLVVESALEAVEKAFDVKLERGANLRFPKMKFKGAFHPTVIRSPVAQQQESDEDQGVDVRVPEHVVKFRHRAELAAATTGGSSDPCRPAEIVVEVHLPELNSTRGVELDITETKLTLESTEPATYALTVPFPYPVAEEKATAKFDKGTRKLSICVPVKEPEVKRLVSTDSGIDVDYEQEGPSSASSSEEEEVVVVEKKRLLTDTEGDLTFPAYTCNIYEDLMIFTLDVKNVDRATLVKATMSEEDFGFGVKFSSVGAGLVSFDFGFYCALVLPKDLSVSLALKDPMQCVDVEIWDNNVLVKISLPRGVDCDQYKVGCNPADLNIHTLPQLRALRKRKEKMMLKKSEEDRSLSIGEDDAFEAAVAATTPTQDQAAEVEENLSGSDGDVSPTVEFEQQSEDGKELKSILKQRKQRCFSESQKDLLSWVGGASCRASSIAEEDEGVSSSGRKKSVRFSEVVQRQIFRPTSSIVGHTQKNLKKKQAKLRRAERRASEGDADELQDEDQEEEEIEEHTDSGVASSVDSAGESVGSGRKGKKSKRRLPGKKPLQQHKFWSESTTDLMFDLDI